MRHRLNILFAFLSLTLFSCHSSLNEETNTEFNGNKKVVLSLDFDTSYGETIHTRGFSPYGSHAEKDVLEKVGLFIFESSTGKKVIEDHTFTLKHQVKLLPGKYDFYILGNALDDMPRYKMSREELNEYLLELKCIKTFNTNSEKMPIIRIYEEQNIDFEDSSNPTQNQKFVPQPPMLHPLRPVSSYGSDGDYVHKINLVRCVANVAVELYGEGVEQIQSMTYNNAPANFSLAELDRERLPEQESIEMPFGLVKNGLSISVNPQYIPECLFGSTEKKGWVKNEIRGDDKPIGRVNYLLIRMHSGTEYKIPIVSNPEEAESNYLEFARNGLNANYDIIRNNSYEFRIEVPLNHRELNVELLVQPWSVVESEMSYRKPHVTAERLTGKGDYKNIDMNRDEIIKFKISIQNANGQDWKMALSNGLDFVLQAEESTSEGELGAYRGAAHDKTTYVFGVKPLKPYEGTPRFTELYLLVNGKEIPLFDGMETGPKNRTVIKQTEIR